MSSIIKKKTNKKPEEHVKNTQTRHFYGSASLNKYTKKHVEVVHSFTEVWALSKQLNDKLGAAEHHLNQASCTLNAACCVASMPLNFSSHPGTGNDWFGTRVTQFLSFLNPPSDQLTDMDKRSLLNIDVKRNI